MFTQLYADWLFARNSTERVFFFRLTEDTHGLWPSMISSIHQSRHVQPRTFIMQENLKQIQSLLSSFQFLAFLKTEKIEKIVHKKFLPITKDWDNGVPSGDN